jgi:ABC-2 type transport system permease protein
MRGWYAVFHKELANFFTSSIAYAVIGSFVLICGFFFWANVSFLNLISLQASNSPMLMQRINLTDVVVRPLVENMGIILLFLMPLITMRLISVEKRSGTIELLLTYPIPDLGVLMGKYAAVTLMLLIMLGATAPFLVLLFYMGTPDIGPLLGGYLGLLLMGAAFMSLGLFISSLTIN